MVSNWIFFLCYICFGKVPGIVSKRLAIHDCGTKCQAWCGKEEQKNILEEN